MPWLLLVAAGIMEVIWAVGLKYTEGFSKLVPSLLTIAAMGASFLLLSAALRTIPLGTAYAVWVGIGALGTAVIGMMVFHEPVTAIRIGCLGLILGGVLGLKLSHA